MNAPMTFGTMHLAPALADFLGQYPDLQVQLTLNDRFIDPIEEGFDVTVRIAQPQETASLIVHPLTTAHEWCVRLPVIWRGMEHQLNPMTCGSIPVCTTVNLPLMLTGH